MRVVIACPATRGVMAHHLRSLARHYPDPNQLVLYVPSTSLGLIDLPCDVVTYPLGQSSWARLGAYFSPLWAWRRFQEIKSLRPDIVHLFNSDGYPSSLLWAWWSHQLPNASFLLSVHDPDPHPGSLVAGVTNLIGRLTRRVAQHVHVFSDRFRVTMESTSAGRQRFFVCALCTDVTEFTKYAKPDIAREPLVLFFGRLEHYKGLDVLVEAAELLRGSFRVAIAGPGKLPPLLLDRIRKRRELFELHNRFLLEIEVARLFQRSSVCVMPYRQASQSTVPHIAAAFGVPVVATDVGAVGDQVRRINGVVVPPGDAHALARGILSAVGREVIVPPEWDPRRVAGEYAEMYRRLVACNS